MTLLHAAVNEELTAEVVCQLRKRLPAWSCRRPGYSRLLIDCGDGIPYMVQFFISNDYEVRIGLIDGAWRFRGFLGNSDFFEAAAAGTIQHILDNTLLFEAPQPRPNEKRTSLVAKACQVAERAAEKNEIEWSCELASYGVEELSRCPLSPARVAREFFFRIVLCELKRQSLEDLQQECTSLSLQLGNLRKDDPSLLTNPIFIYAGGNSPQGESARESDSLDTQPFKWFHQHATLEKIMAACELAP